MKRYKSKFKEKKELREQSWKNPLNDLMSDTIEPAFWEDLIFKNKADAQKAKSYLAKLVQNIKIEDWRFDDEE